MPNRLSIVTAALVVGGLLVWLHARRSPAAAPAPALLAAATVEAPRSAPPPTRAPLPAPIRRSLPPLPPTVPTAPRPTALSPDQVPYSPELVAGLERLSREERIWLDYKLRFLAALDRCLAGQPTSAGRVGLRLHFRLDETHRLGTGSRVEMRDSTLPSADDALLLDCARAAHEGERMVFPPESEADDDVQLTTQLTLPIADDPVYAFVRTGRWP